ncbi:ABC-type multidrug transport system, ATPase and permease components [Candidatus Planktophila dulcis]|uniref:ABC transporter ATP-binding protein n=1 Tax=Candidatus Planktophila dulcis TaxID=1884914 RepID=UPI000BBF877B|nr:ABC transporter ATP-binding protein [Candidatus Planktophila dulcis]ASY21920.1 ABC-type multidrug transport system, ATPase and permease components [Candidatus Planktophila dulcis]
MDSRFQPLSNLMIIKRSANVLTRSERIKVLIVVAIQIFLSLLDLLGVALVGVLGSLAISGVGSRKPGNRVWSFLEYLGIQDLTLQRQALILGIMAASVLVIKTACSMFLLRKVTFFLSRRGALVSARLLSKLLSQPISSLQNRSMQQTLYLVNTGVDSITMGILNSATQMTSDASLLLILLAGLFLVDPIIALSTLLVFVGVAWVLYRLLEVKSKQLGISEASLSIANNEKTLEVLNSYREIIVRNRRSFYAREIGKIRMLAADNAASRNFMPNISKYVIELTLVLGSLSISAIQFILNDAAHAVAVLSVFMAASTRIAPAVLRMQQAALNIKARMGSAEPALALIEELESIHPVEKVDDSIQYTHRGFVPKLTLEKVSFSYPNSKLAAISEITLDIQPGRMVAIVGPSGSGKTTLVDLMLGILEPSSGTIGLSSQKPLQAISQWPGAIGYVPQDVMISNGTIAENIGMGFPTHAITDEAILQAIKVSQLSDYLDSLPRGINTKVGDKGNLMSGGQRQRLGIARAMLTVPKLLILDEATSSLDGETESNVTSALLSLKGEVTVILIAHRLSTIREADDVVYMENGSIVAKGTFDEVRNSVPNFEKQAALMGL